MKTKKLWRQPFIVKFTFEIYKYFSKYFLNVDYRKILGAGFKSYVQLGPSFLFTSFQRSAWIATDSLVILLLQKAVFISYPNINWKGNCWWAIIQIFLSEIIQFQENGGWGDHFGQSLYLQLYQGLNPLCNDAWSMSPK